MDQSHFATNKKKKYKGHAWYMTHAARLP